MNRLAIIGNLTRDVELTQTASGISVARFCVAVKHNYDSFNATVIKTTSTTKTKK